MTIEEWFNSIPDKQVCQWGTWKSDAQESGLVVTEDKSGWENDTTLTKPEAQTAFAMCEVTIASEDTQKKIEEWSKEYDTLIKTPPANGDYLVTCDGSKVKLDVIKVLHKSPFISTRAYVPEIIGQPLGWFVTGENEIRTHGWRVILGTKSRDECIRRFGITPNQIFVRRLRVLRISFDGQSIVAEVSDWD